MELLLQLTNRHISVLMAILNLKPKSVYALAKITNTDVSNMKKVISFFEAIASNRDLENRIRLLFGRGNN